MFLSPMSLPKRILLSLLRILIGVPIVSLILGGLLLLVFGVTWTGRSVGLSIAIFGCVLYCSVGCWQRAWFQRIRRRFYAVLIPAALLLYCIPLFLAPSGGTSDGPVRNCFLHGQGAFSRYSPWNVIPEADRVAAGIHLLRLRDVHSAEATRLRSLVLPLYAEMDQDPDFRELGSVQHMGYRELLGLEFRTGHYHVFLPKAKGGEKLPCLIFLHGVGGNMKTCLWVLSRQNRCAVIAPTFGMGNWDQPGGAEFVADVAREAMATLPLDPRKIFLMGYSNGAMGVTRAAVKAPGLFAGFVYLSPITEDEFFSTAEFSSQAGHARVLVLHGNRDERIPQSLVAGTAGSLRRMGFEVRTKFYDDEDHYLLFSQPQSVVADILEWMESGSEKRR